MYHVAVKGVIILSFVYSQTIQHESNWRKDECDSGEGSFSNHEVAEFELVRRYSFVFSSDTTRTAHMLQQQIYTTNIAGSARPGRPGRLKRARE